MILKTQKMQFFREIRYPKAAETIENTEFLSFGRCI